MNDIKLDQTNNTNTRLTQPKPLNKGQQKSLSNVNTDDITVNMHSLEGMVLATDNSAKVADMKRLIEAGAYQIDAQALAEKLYRLSLTK